LNFLHLYYILLLRIAIWIFLTYRSWWLSGWAPVSRPEGCKFEPLLDQVRQTLDMKIRSNCSFAKAKHLEEKIMAL
jgi:hypothetical protein